MRQRGREAANARKDRLLLEQQLTSSLPRLIYEVWSELGALGSKETAWRALRGWHRLCLEGKSPQPALEFFWLRGQCS